MGLGLAACLVSGETRQLDGAFHRLGAAVGEEDAIQTRKLAQALGQSSLVFVVIEIRNVNDPGRLLPDGLHDARMSMPERVHAQPGHEVEILLAFEVVEENTFATLKAHGIAVVGGEKKALFKIDDLIEASHGFNCRTNEGGRAAQHPLIRKDRERVVHPQSARYGHSLWGLRIHGWNRRAAFPGSERPRRKQRS